MGIALDARSLHSAKAVLAGGWQLGPRRSWQGTVSADEPIVGLAIQESYGKWSWCKSAARTGLVQEVSLHLGEFDPLGVDVKVTFACGDGQVVSRCEVSSNAYMPTMPETIVTETGKLTTVATVNGQPEVRLVLLLLARRDVGMGRNRLWHLRRELAEEVGEPFRRVLSYGRTGETAV